MTTAFMDDVDSDRSTFSDPDDDVSRETARPAADPDADPDAPYGRNPRTGKPYRESADARAARARAMNEARWGSRPRGPRAPSKTAGKPSAKAGRPDYRSGLLGLLQLPAFALGVVARVTGSEALALDAATITLHAPDVADAVAETAHTQQWLADILDRCMAVGPYGALLGAALPLAMQLAANHGRIEPNPDLGILDRDQLIAALKTQR